MRHRRPLLLLSLAAALCWTGSAGASAVSSSGQENAVAGTAAAGGPWQPSPEEREMSARMLALLNDHRADEGLERLTADPELQLLAFQHAREMATRGSVTHHSYWFGLGTRSRVRLAFPGIFRFAENVASNRGPEALHRALLRSPGHRLNRLDPAFTHAGIGVARAGEHQVYVAEVFVRAASPELLDLNVLYTAAEAPTLPPEDPEHGEVTSERIVVGRPGPEDPQYWTERGIDAFAARRHEDAAKHFRRALELDPDYHFARFNLGRALLRSGEPGEAAAVLEVHLEEFPDDVDAWLTLGTATLVRQRYERAEQAFRRVIAVRRRNAGAWYNLGLTLEYQGRLEDAERAYSQALHLDPKLDAAREALRRVRN